MQLYFVHFDANTDGEAIAVSDLSPKVSGFGWHLVVLAEDEEGALRRGWKFLERVGGIWVEANGSAERTDGAMEVCRMMVNSSLHPKSLMEIRDLARKALGE